jgi:hypothetical protein
MAHAAQSVQRRELREPRKAGSADVHPHRATRSRGAEPGVLIIADDLSGAADSAVALADRADTVVLLDAEAPVRAGNCIRAPMRAGLVKRAVGP